jgi:hypothetical protein
VGLWFKKAAKYGPLRHFCSRFFPKSDRLLGLFAWKDYNSEVLAGQAVDLRDPKEHIKGPNGPMLSARENLMPFFPCLAEPLMSFDTSLF